MPCAKPWQESASLRRIRLDDESKILLACLCLLVAVLFTDAAAAERRVALIIGNSAYKNAPTLANTTADAVGLAQLFRSAGFETVILRNDLGVMDFRRTVRDFLLIAEGADIAVVYCAGHGIEIGGMNYLVPVDAKLSRAYDVDDEAVALDRIVWELQSVKRLRLILLDACRDNPFPDRMRSAGVRALEGRGLVNPIEVGADTLVAYAAKAGSKPYDGDGANSPYATALLRHLAEPGVEIRIALGRVRDDVLAMTGGRQEPFIYGSLGGATNTADRRLPEVARACLAALGGQLRALKAQILEFDRRIIAWHRSSATSKRLDAIPSVGPALASFWRLSRNLRVRPETSCRIAELSEHEAD